MPKLLTREEAADFLRLPLHTLDSLRHAGDLPYVRIRNVIRLVREDVLEFLARNYVSR